MNQELVIFRLKQVWHYSLGQIFKRSYVKQEINSDHYQSKINKENYMRNIIKITLLVIVVSFTILAQQPTLKDSLLNHMTGYWVLQGTVAGQETVHDIESEWVLSHQYILIRETSREKNTGGGPAYEANVYLGWDQISSEYVCIWIDIFGGFTSQSIGRAKPDDNEIHFIFRDSSNTDVFHTTFTYNNDTDTWQWLMDNIYKGKLQQFANVKLTKKRTDK
jgi:hypothetical protein